MVGVRIRPFNDREKALNAQAGTKRRHEDAMNIYACARVYIYIYTSSLYMDINSYPMRKNN